MRYHQPFLKFVVAILVAVVVNGCSDGKPTVDSSLTEAKVTGKVTVKGVPATGGKIQFNPSNSGRIVPIRAAEIGPDGSYTVTTLTGGNQVTFDGEVASKNRGVGLIKEYADVAAGSNSFDFDLMGEKSSKKGIGFSIPERAKAKR